MMENKNFDIDVLISENIGDCVKEDEAYFDSLDDLIEENASEELNERVIKLIDKKYEKNKRRSVKPLFALLAAAILLIACGFSAMAHSNSFIDRLIQKYKDYFVLNPIVMTNTENTNNTIKVFTSEEPTWFPETEYDRIVKEENDYEILIDYKFNNYIIEYCKAKDTKGDKKLDNLSTDIQVLNINGLNAYYIKNNNTNKIIVYSNSALYSITAPLELEQLIKITESIFVN